MMLQRGTLNIILKQAGLKEVGGDVEIYDCN